MNIRLTGNSVTDRTRRSETTPLDENPARNQLERGLSNQLLASSSPDHYQHWEWDRDLSYGQAAKKSLAAMEGSNLKDFQTRLDADLKHADRLEKRGIALTAGLGLAFLALAPGVLPAAAIGGAAGFALTAFAHFGAADKARGEATGAKEGLEVAAQWAGRDDAPGPVPREELLSDMRSHVQKNVARGNLREVWRSIPLQQTLQGVEGDDSLGMLENLERSDLFQAVQWIRNPVVARDGREQAVPVDTSLSLLKERVTASINDHLAEERYGEARASLDTLGMLERSQAENWSGFIEEVLHQHKSSFEASPESLLVPKSRSVRVLQTRIDDIVDSFNDDPKPTSRRKSRAEVVAELEEKNETRFLSDYPNENRARRALNKLSGSDLIEMVNQPGEKNRKRAELLLEALRDSKLEWIIGSD